MSSGRLADAETPLRHHYCLHGRLFEPLQEHRDQAAPQGMGGVALAMRCDNYPGRKVA